jgi:hypothetical protein
MAQKNPYKRIAKARRSVRAPGEYSLWLGDDHLAYLQYFMYTEEYKRFYFEDIEAVIVRKNAAYWIWAPVFLVLAGIFFLFGLLGSWQIGLGAAAPFLICLAIHLVRGATYSCYLKTAVQEERLYCITRARHVDKLLAVLQSRTATDSASSH